MGKLRIRKKSNFTFVEIMTAMTIFVIIFGFFLQSHAYLHKLRAESIEREKLVYVAQNVVESYKNENLNIIDEFNDDYDIEVYKEINSNYKEVTVVVSSLRNENMKVEISSYILKRNIVY